MIEILILIVTCITIIVMVYLFKKDFTNNQLEHYKSLYESDEAIIKLKHEAIQIQEGRIETRDNIIEVQKEKIKELECRLEFYKDMSNKKGKMIEGLLAAKEQEGEKQ